VYCECFYAVDGYASARECLDANVFPIPSRAVSCGDRALAADGTGQVRASIQCLVDHGTARNACHRAAACDPAATDVCNTDYFVAVAACPQPDASAQADFDAALRACTSGGGGGGPQIDVCPEDDLGSATGASVATGSTTGDDNDVASSCGGDFANDAAFTWVAPTTGNVTISNTGSDFDTVLHVFAGNSCAGAELACDDDGGDFIDSSITLGVTMAQSIVIVVDGFGSDDGDFVLNIHY
jgi:hypothetical protein